MPSLLYSHVNFMCHHTFFLVHTAALQVAVGNREYEVCRDSRCSVVSKVWQCIELSWDIQFSLFI